MTAPTLNRPDIDTLEHLDFAPSCNAAPASNPESDCPNTATFYVEVHRIGSCTTEPCDPNGNMCGNVCGPHKDAFLAMGRNLIDQINIIKQAHPGRAVTCPTCSREINQVSDVVQKVIAL